MGKSQVTICSKIQYCAEAFNLLQMLPMRKGEEDERGSGILAQFGTENLQAKKIADWMDEVRMAAREEFAEEMERIQELFEKNSKDIILASCVLGNNMWFSFDLGESVDQMKEGYQKLSSYYKDAHFATEITGDYIDKEEFWKLFGREGESTEVPEPMRIRHVFSLIHKMDATYEEKAKIEETFLNRESIAEEIFGYMYKAEQFLKRYEKRLKEFQTNWEHCWMKLLEEGRFLQVMKDFGLSESTIDKDCVLRPSFVQVAVIYLLFSDGTLVSENKNTVLCIGLIISEILEDVAANRVNNNQRTQEQVQQSLKLLAEKSKLDILMYLKEEAAYGSQIAQHFGLTTATVSHHMNKLMNQGLITIEQRERRLYYRTNKKELEKIFDSCKHIFDL